MCGGSSRNSTATTATASTMSPSGYSDNSDTSSVERPTATGRITSWKIAAPPPTISVVASSAKVTRSARLPSRSGKCNSPISAIGKHSAKNRSPIDGNAVVWATSER